MRGIFLLVAVAALTGCGDEVAYVANAVDLRVEFSNRLVSVDFELNPEYHIQKNTRITFSSDSVILSKISTVYDSAIPKSHLNATFSAANLMSEEWVTKDFKEFPNLHRLPKSVPAGILKSITKEENEIDVLSLHQKEPYLIVGGAILSSDFTKLPPGFLAHQYFKDEYGGIVASISITGPTLTTKGGIYFLGNFGLNPFAIRDMRFRSHIRAMGERANVISQGQGKIKFFSIFDLLRNLEEKLLIFEE